MTPKMARLYDDLHMALSAAYYLVQIPKEASKKDKKDIIKTLNEIEKEHRAGMAQVYKDRVTSQLMGTKLKWEEKK